MIFDAYLIREVARPLFALVLLLVGVFMAYSLTRFLGEANDGLLSARVVAVLTGLKVVIALEVLLPVALYVALIVALGRLYTDWEIVALRASGAGETRVIVPVLAVAVVVAAVVLALSMWIRPWAYGVLYALESEGEANAELDDLRAGQFHVSSDAERMVFFDKQDSRTGEMIGLFVRARSGRDLEVISSVHGRLRAFDRPDTHRLDLQQAFVYRRVADGTDLVGQFGEFSIRVPAVVAEPVGYKPKAMTSSDLFASDDDNDRAELQWRASTPISTLLLALVAVPLSRTRPRSGRYARVFLAIVIYVVYFNAIGIARSAVEQGTLDSLWLAPAGLAALVGAGMLALRRTAG